VKQAAAALLSVAMCVVLGAGCKSQQAQHAMLRGELPTYDKVAEGYNARVTPLERLWARTVVRFTFVDANGKSQTEQVEGHCQYIRPRRTLVSFHKAGHPLAMLGSNEDRFWWIELGEQKRAFVGTHAAATPDRIAAAGLRVHPIDLMELLGLTPLPSAGEGCTVGASADNRHLVVTIPGESSKRRLFLSPATLQPSRIELVDATGRVSAFSQLAKYRAVALKGAPPEVPRPWVATDIRVEADNGATKVIMELSEPQNDPGRFKPAAFDFDRLVEAYGVNEIRDLDKDEPAALK
jgi:hypothetical protein